MAIIPPTADAAASAAFFDVLCPVAAADSTFATVPLSAASARCFSTEAIASAASSLSFSAAISVMYWFSCSDEKSYTNPKRRAKVTTAGASSSGTALGLEATSRSLSISACKAKRASEYACSR